METDIFKDRLARMEREAALEHEIAKLDGGSGNRKFEETRGALSVIERIKELYSEKEGLFEKIISELEKIAKAKGERNEKEQENEKIIGIWEAINILNTRKALHENLLETLKVMEVKTDDNFSIVTKEEGHGSGDRTYRQTLGVWQEIKKVVESLQAENDPTLTPTKALMIRKLFASRIFGWLPKGRKKGKTYLFYRDSSELEPYEQMGYYIEHEILGMIEGTRIEIMEKFLEIRKNNIK